MTNKARRLSGINTLAYMGIDPITAPYLVVEQRIPTQNDLVGMQIGALWILEEDFQNNVAPRIFVLCGLNRNIADWVELQTGLTSLTTYVTNSGSAIPVAGILNVLGASASGGVASNIEASASGNILLVSLNNSISQPNTNSTGTEGLYSLGGAGAAFRFMGDYGSTTNTFLGVTAGTLAVTGLNNTGLGYQSLNSIGIGHENTATGSGSLQNALDIAQNNCAYGYQALNATTQGVNNCAFGYQSLMSLGNADDNCAMGYQTMLNCTGAGSNVAIGRSVWDTGIGVSNYNVLLGHQVARSITSGQKNISLGYRSLAANDVGSNSIAIGELALASTTADGNIAIGQFSSQQMTSGSQNISIGNASLSTGTLTGTNNIALGGNTGNSYTGAESGNILLGSSVTGTVGESNTTRIGVQGTQTKCVIAGIRGVTTGNANAIAVLVDSAGQLGTVSSSRRYKENIDDMDDASDALYKLRPVVFNYKADETKRMQYGLIAEEVEEAMPRMVVYNEDGLPETVKYHDLPVLLLNEIQLLNARITDLEDTRISRRSTCKECSISIQ